MKSKLESVWATQKLWQQKNTTVMITESAGKGEQKNPLVYAHFSMFLWRRAPQKRCRYLHVSRNYAACSCLPQCTAWTWSIPTQCPQYPLRCIKCSSGGDGYRRDGQVSPAHWKGSQLSVKRSSTSASAGKHLVARTKWGAPASSQRVHVSWGIFSLVWGSVCDAGTVLNCCGEFTSMSKFQLSPMAMSSR